MIYKKLSQRDVDQNEDNSHKETTNRNTVWALEMLQDWMREEKEGLKSTLYSCCCYFHHMFRLQRGYEGKS